MAQLSLPWAVKKWNSLKNNYSWQITPPYGMGVFLWYNIYMLMFSLLSWWYSDGWKTFTGELLHGLRNTADFFSISSLFKTFFAPFRQISAHEKFLDRLISRIVGSAVRFFLIIYRLLNLSFIILLTSPISNLPFNEGVTSNFFPLILNFIISPFLT